MDGEENIFVSFKPPRPGTEPRTLAWKAAVLTTTLGPPPSKPEGDNQVQVWIHSNPQENMSQCWVDVEPKSYTIHSNPQENMSQCWVDVEPKSYTVGQHQPNIGWTSLVCWVYITYWKQKIVSTCPAKVSYLNFHPLEVVSRFRDSRGSETQLQVGENYSYYWEICNFCFPNTHLIPSWTVIWSALIRRIKSDYSRA